MTPQGTDLVAADARKKGVTTIPPSTDLGPGGAWGDSRSVSIYLPARLPTCLSAYLPTYLPAYLSTCLSAYLLIYL